MPVPIFYKRATEIIELGMLAAEVFWGVTFIDGQLGENGISREIFKASFVLLLVHNVLFPVFVGSALIFWVAGCLSNWTGAMVCSS